ncbi:MAG: extracellular solute-binding protein [Oscillospiraceae bacterium]
MINNKKKLRLMSLITVIALVLTGCFSNGSNGTSSKEEGVVNVYSARHYDVDKKIYDDFYSKTGIKVNVIEGKAPEILERMKREGADTQADIFITADIANLYQAIEEDLSMEIKSSLIDSTVPKNLRGENNEWMALTTRARIIAYDKDKVNPSSLKSYDSLVEDNFKNKILVRSSTSSYNQSLLASFIAEKGEEYAKKWAEGIVKNLSREPKGNDRDQVKAIASGEGEIAILNTYYLGRMKTSDDPEEVKAFDAVSIYFPESTHINVSGAVMNKYSKNKENAVKLLEYLVSVDVQKQYTDENYEYPVNQSVEPTQVLKDLGSFKAQDINLTEAGKYNKKATEIFGQVGWK